MTCYNREKFLSDAIKSVLESDFIDFELIIVDDCSTDNSLFLINTYAKKDKRIRVYSNKTNIGDYPNRNYAASLANGEFLMFLDSDDIIYPDSITKILNFIGKYPEAGFAISCPKLISSKAIRLTSRQAIYNHFFKTPFLLSGPGGTVHRKSYFQELNGYTTKYGPANDMYHNLKAACYSSIIILPFEISYYRIHDQQESNDKFKYIYNNYNYLKDAIVQLPLKLSPKQKRIVQNKNRRRFIVNVVKYFKRTRDFKMVLFALRETKFSLYDFIIGLFHFK